MKEQEESEADGEYLDALREQIDKKDKELFNTIEARGHEKRRPLEN